jgi:hypothetical protein
LANPEIIREIEDLIDLLNLAEVALSSGGGAGRVRRRIPNDVRCYDLSQIDGPYCRWRF